MIVDEEMNTIKYMSEKVVHGIASLDWQIGALLTAPSGWLGADHILWSDVLCCITKILKTCSMVRERGIKTPCTTYIEQSSWKEDKSWPFRLAFTEPCIPVELRSQLDLRFCTPVQLICRFIGKTSHHFKRTKIINSFGRHWYHHIFNREDGTSWFLSGSRCKH